MKLLIKDGLEILPLEVLPPTFFFFSNDIFCFEYCFRPEVLVRSYPPETYFIVYRKWPNGQRQRNSDWGINTG